ncbi:hypothetical protein ACWN83_07765 [Pseudolactococcus plantarum]|uniref:Uncharacterized protein n=1 Tax=Pseudolactococcus plantarum TaxID=1365 RepID=A0A2A5RYN0_9LACT|nr:hypothetical protein [Lactococcus plantarum]PCS06323.1 hypothetical protein RU87_GL001844 [Lactococcus plantarum]HCN75527.1 hypothetical protein [Lactococcus sp.]
MQEMLKINHPKFIGSNYVLNAANKERKKVYVSLENDVFEVRITFEGFVYGVFSYDESLLQGRMAELARLAKQNDIVLRDEEGYVFEIKKSTLVEYTQQNSYRFYEQIGEELLHIIVYTENDVVELITDTLPMFTMFKKLV